jgi:acyl-CoA thioesterase FadM
MAVSESNEATIQHGPNEIEGYGVFNHKLNSRVRSYDVDRQSIVHNAIYLYWLEAARSEYFGFEHVIRREDGVILATAKSVLVHLNPASHGPERIPDSYRTLIREFEGSATRFID